MWGQLWGAVRDLGIPKIISLLFFFGFVLSSACNARAWCSYHFFAKRLICVGFVYFLSSYLILFFFFSNKCHTDFNLWQTKTDIFNKMCSQLKTVLRHLNKMSVTCFGQNTSRNPVLYILQRWWSIQLSSLRRTASEHVWPSVLSTCYVHVTHGHIDTNKLTPHPYLHCFNHWIKQSRMRLLSEAYTAS